MRNFAKDVEEEIGDEEVVGVTIGSSREYCYHEKTQPVMSWEEARPLLDYGYYGGCRGVGRDCHAITLWTPTRVIFVAEYDGSTRLDSVPRHPVPHAPESI